MKKIKFKEEAKKIKYDPTGNVDDNRETAFFQLCYFRKNLPGVFGYALNDFESKFGKITSYEEDILTNGTVKPIECMFEPPRIEVPERMKVHVEFGNREFGMKEATVEIDGYELAFGTDRAAILNWVANSIIGRIV